MIEELQLISPGAIRVRFAPSPTGPAHIGLIRTALFNYLFAQKYQGIFILRIEDTDLERSKLEWEKQIIETLNWLGLGFQEGPEIGGNFGPYRQSQRKEIYKRYIERLLQEKKLYYCFCSQEELEAHRNYLASIGEPFRYSERCANLSEKEIKKNLTQNKNFVLRFKTPIKKIVFKDLVRGKIEYDSANFGDMVVAKGISEPLYNLASVIDDFEMKITHIIRGEDHIPNTPKQILLAEALGIEVPKYIHLPLILGPDKVKLSKRHEVKSIIEYKKDGYLPIALLNFLALLGWNPGDDKEIFSLSSLAQAFSLQGIQRSAAIFNPQKLDWINGFYIRQKPLDKLTELCIPYLIEADLIDPYFETEKYPPAYGAEIIMQRFKIRQTNEELSFNYLMNVIKLYQERLKKLSEISELVDFFFKKDLNYSKELLIWKNSDKEETKKNLDRLKKILDKIKEEDWTKNNLEQILLKLMLDIGEGDRGKILWPLRVSLTGKEASAGLFEIAELLGKEKTLERIKKAKEKLS